MLEGERQWEEWRSMKNKYLLAAARVLSSTHCFPLYSSVCGLVTQTPFLSDNVLANVLRCKQGAYTPDM